MKNTSQIIADLQLHSKYSRAVSKNMVVSEIADWARKKGIRLIATGDWMHPIWFQELKESLVEVADGLYGLKEDKKSKNSDVRFLLSGEISSIYSQGGRSRRVHTLVFAPNFAVAEKINSELVKRGCNLSSDGRPIVGLSAREIADIALTASDRVLVIPAHVWTPWFGVYGSKSGFETLEECFGELAKSVYAVETGLSSDPSMNWSVEELGKRAILSFSDAHSGAKIGREATVFSVQRSASSAQDYTYNDVYWAIAERFKGENKGQLKISTTIEFYPEEGKYHYSGHRKCKVVQKPGEDMHLGSICHVCGKPLTLGVMNRVGELSQIGRTKNEGFPIKPVVRVDEHGVSKYSHPNDPSCPDYVLVVPLMEILAQVHEVGPQSVTVERAYEKLLGEFGSEFNVLLTTACEEVGKVGGERLSEALSRVRRGEIAVQPGYDGVFGIVHIWGNVSSEREDDEQQMMIFS